jgi:hypothetical protein
MLRQRKRSSLQRSDLARKANAIEAIAELQKDKRFEATTADHVKTLQKSRRVLQQKRK